MASILDLGCFSPPAQQFRLTRGTSIALLYVLECNKRMHMLTVFIVYNYDSKIRFKTNLFNQIIMNIYPIVNQEFIESY